MQEHYDAVIVGGGPAGASCAIWLSRLGLRPILVEARGQVGGQENDNPFADDWIAVLPGLTGQQVAGQIAQSVRAAGVCLLLNASARRVAPTGGGFEVGIESSNEPEKFALGMPATLRAHCLVIAVGVRPRGLNRLSPAGGWPGVLVGPGSEVAKQDYREKRVAILGGGDNAFENYDYVRRRGASAVRIYARHVRARRQFVQRVDPGDVRIGRYAIDPAARTVAGEPYDLILVLYGWEPHAPFVDALALARDEHGFLRTDFATARTSMPGVYAIGEVARRMHPCVVTAMADGVVAAKAIQSERDK